ncbi:hypothetical protein [Mycolicibacterium sp.]|uniref:hypothetical protein n=1 Tax=Mycolicibacterium sp. TaxID=2320850 RepID=UPI000939F13B|nr:hypothetical protein [Mycobacterium sp. DSM 3803]OKH81674.1 membrane protein [Mycobacterium sp. SWH-M3]
MGRTVAVTWHASFSLVAAGLYFFFVVPRWPELMGQTSPTLGLVLRIVTAVLIGLAALPVVFTLLRTKRPEYATPHLALRLRTSSIVMHVLAAVLILGAAISEIWLNLDDAGQWLFGIYGAAAAIALLGIFGFYLAFVAELPPPAPKPLKTSEKKGRGRRKQSDEADDDTEEAAESEADETDDAAAEDTEAEDDADAPAEVTAEEPESGADEVEPVEAVTAESEADDTESGEPEAEAPRGKLRNRRPANKGGVSRLRRRSRGGVAVDD